jgi:hypothetical protein
LRRKNTDHLLNLQFSFASARRPGNEVYQPPFIVYYIIFIAARHKGNRQNVPQQGNILAISAIAKSDCPVVLRNITPSPVVYFQFSPTIGESKTKGNKNETKVLKGGERKNPIPLLQQQYGGQSACRPIRHLQANHLQLDKRQTETIHHCAGNDQTCSKLEGYTHLEDAT